MIVAQTDYVIHPNIIRQWSALDKELNKLKKFDSETFYPQHNLKMIECYYPELEQLNQDDKDQNIWGFKFENNLSGQEYILILVVLIELLQLWIITFNHF